MEKWERSGLRLSTTNLGQVPEHPISAPHPHRLSHGLTERECGRGAAGSRRSLLREESRTRQHRAYLDREVSRKSGTSLLGLSAKF